MSFLFPLGPYLVVITKKTLVGHIKGHEVWIIKGTDILAFPRATLHLTESQVDTKWLCESRRLYTDIEFTDEEIINLTPACFCKQIVNLIL